MRLSPLGTACFALQYYLDNDQKLKKFVPIIKVWVGKFSSGPENRGSSSDNSSDESSSSGEGWSHANIRLGSFTNGKAADLCKAAAYG
jgi:hypothetical protein